MRIDVILATYAGERWVEEAINSVLQQTYPHWHVTVVDDASPDDTIQRVEVFCRTYPERITLMRLAQNRGAVVARMEAIRKTSGDIIAFLDQDDRWRPHKLQRQIERFRAQPTVQAVHTDVVHIDAEGKLLVGRADEENARRASISYERLSSEDLSGSLCLNNSIRLVSAAVLRKAFQDVGGFNESLFGGEDWEFWVRFANRWRIGHVAEPLVERRFHARNTSTCFQRPRTLGLLAALDIAERSYPHLTLLASKRRVSLLKRAVRIELESGERAKVQRYAWSLVRLKPLNGKALALLGLSFAGPFAPLVSKAYRRLKLWIQQKRK